jgi:hypothetical protein
MKDTTNGTPTGYNQRERELLPGLPVQGIAEPQINRNRCIGLTAYQCEND